MAIVKCDKCECTFDITRCEAKNPGGVVSGCPHDSEQCGIAERGYNITVKERDDDE